VCRENVLEILGVKILMFSFQSSVLSPLNPSQKNSMVDFFTGSILCRYLIPGG
jgi:hypothetical protein